MGRLISGENDHGIELKIMSSAMVNHIAIILNFSLLVDFLFALAEPIVISVIAISIMVMCSMPKKRIARSCTAVLKLCIKYDTIGLIKYSHKPNVS